MEKILNKNLSFDEIYIMFFPIVILFRSAALNLYIIFGACFFLYKFYKKKNLFLNKEKKIIFILIFFFFIYFIINSLTAENFLSSIKSSLSQIRFLFFCFFIGTLSISIKNINKIILILSSIISFISIDTLYQYFFDYDLFGIQADPLNNPNRLSGPFGKELIVGAYLTYFTIPIVAYFFFNLKNNSKLNSLFFLLVILISFLSILLSGERLSLLIFLVSFLIIIFLKYKTKFFLISLFFLIIFLSLSYKYNNSVQYRFDEFIYQVKQLQNSSHGRLFSSAIIVGENKLLTGAGLENYREDCDILKNRNFIDPFTHEKILCSTHPHNIYLEIFSEGGLIGLLIFFTFITFSIYFIWQNFYKIESHLKFLFISSIVILASYIWPIKSSGSFFSTFSASFFWFYFGLMMMLTNKKL